MTSSLKGRVMALTALLLPALLGFSCGGSAVYSCDLRSTELFTCREYGNLSDVLQIDTLSGDCTSPPSAGASAGVWSEAPCSHDGALGGCMLSDDQTSLTLWYYAGGTSDATSVMNNCTGTYVSP